MKNYKNILFIDGGGTKISGFLWNQKNLSLIKQEKLDMMANLFFSEKKTKISFIELQKLFSEYDIDTIHVSLAGYSKKIKSHQEFLEYIKNIFNTKEVFFYKDIEFLSEAFGTEESMVMILGTGSAYMKKENGENIIYGGWGHLFGDEGSAYSFSKEIIKRVIEEIESNKNILTKKVFDYYDVNNSDEFKKKLYSFEEKKSIASLGKVISESNEFKEIVDEILIIESNKIKNKILTIDKNNLIKEIYLDGGFIKNNNEYLEKLKNIFPSKKLYLIDWNSETSLNPMIKILKK